MEISGVPLHPLVVHAVVVMAPLAGLTGVAYALVPRWRWLLRWPLVAVAVVAAGAAVLAVASGNSLLNDRPELRRLDTVTSHMTAGSRLRWVLLVDLAVALGAALWLGGPSALASGRGAGERRGTAGRVLSALLVLTSLAVMYAAFRAGDSGARAVWG